MKEMRVQGSLETVAGASGLVDLIAVDPVEGGWRNRMSLLNPAGQALGGQIAAHALMAGCASGTGEPGAFHLLFVDGGTSDRPYSIAVEGLRDGRRLAHRALRIVQDGRLLAHGSMMLRSEDDAAEAAGIAHQVSMPEAPPPDDLPTRAMLLDRAIDPTPLGRIMLQSFPFLDIRDFSVGASRKALFWLRIPGSEGLDVRQHYGLLTLASDYWYSLPIHSVFPDREQATRTLITTSLDHAMWFHARPDCADWMLVEMDARVASGRYGMVRAQVWRADGVLVATVAQQVLLRPLSGL